jgi:integrase
MELNRVRTACNWAAKTGLIKGEWLAHNVWVPSQGPGDTKKAIARAIGRTGPGGRRIGLHTLRHTLATWAASKQGMDMRVVQRLLGHEQIKTTDKIYAKHRSGYKRTAVDVTDLASLRKSKKTPFKVYTEPYHPHERAPGTA